MREIHSRQNEEIKVISKLKTQKERIVQKKFLAEGFRVCQTLICNMSPENIYCTQKSLEKAKMLISDKNIKNLQDVQDIIVIVANPVMKKLSSAKCPSGIVCVFPMQKNPEPQALSSGIVLANVSDPGNMGTLIRTCAAMGFKSVVTIEGADPFGPKVIQSSAGEIGKVAIFNLSWQQLLENKKDLQLISLVVSGGKKSKDINLKNALLVIGSEAHGIPQDWIADCDQKLTLSMPGKTESLNAAIAGSIAMYLAIE